MKAFDEIRKFVSVLRMSHPYIIWILAGYGIFTAIIPFLSLYLSAQILNALIDRAYDNAFQLVLMMSIAILVCSLVSKLLYNQLQVIRRTAVQGVDRNLLHKAMMMEYEELESQKTIDILRRTRNSINGSGSIGDALQRLSLCVVAVCKILLAIIALLMTLIQIHVWDGYLALLLVVLFISLLVKNHFAKRHGQLLADLCNGNDRNNAESGYLISLFYQLGFAKEVRLYHMDSLLHRKSDVLLKDPLYRRFGKDNGKLLFFNDLFTQLLTFAAYLYVATLALRSIISIGEVLFLSGLILNAVNAIAEFQVDYAQLCHQLSYLNAFYDFMNMPAMHYDGTLPVEKRDDHAYEFEFRHVSFRYPDTDTDVLKDVSIKFRLQEKLAIVGMNGAGKTTIVKLLCRLYEPTEGEILLNGIQIAHYDYAEYTSLFSVVFQDFKLFSYPLDENVACGKQVDQEKLKAVLQQLDLQQRVASFHNQEHSLLYQDNGDGVSVSGGEAQKLAIARALYKDASFVILDEPTAALDPISEAEIYEHFDLLVREKTTLYISHRMSSCKFCDRILVLAKGEIVEEGDHEQLVKQNGIYRKLWNAQAKYYKQ